MSRDGAGDVVILKTATAEVAQIDTRIVFTGLVGLVALERLVELLLSRRNAARALLRGGVEHGRGHYRWMVLAHTTFLGACVAEVWLLDRPFVPLLGLPMLLLVVFTMALRYWVVWTLGERWNTRVICVPGDSPIDSGPFRLIRHPNYLAVILELAALPLVHCAWLSAVVFGIVNAAILRVRIAVEERALATSSEYDAVFCHRARLVPTLRPQGRHE